MLRAETQADEGHVRPLPLRRGADLLDVDLAGYHVVTEPDHDLRKQLEPVTPLVCDQDSEVQLGFGHLRTLRRPSETNGSREQSVLEPRTVLRMTSTSSN